MTLPAMASGPRILITGAHGFVGSRLLAKLAKTHPGWRLDTPVASKEADPSGEEGLDITDAGAVETWVRERRPDVVIHLAAVAAVTASVKDPRWAWRVNLDGTLNLVLALREYAPGAHFILVSSAEVYGASFSSGSPIDETALLQPLNPYAASKAAADILVRQAAAEGLFATIMRPFNHTGPGQSEAFVAPSFAGQIARIEAGLQPAVISVGNLDEERDFLDVEDVVSAYAAILENRDRLFTGEVFNVASGQSMRIGDMLEHLLSHARIPITVQVDASRLRQASVKKVVGDAGLLQRRVGWRPSRPFRETLVQLLDHSRRLYKI